MGLARDLFGLDLWTRQAEAAQAVVDHDAVAIRSGHKVGKSTLLAFLIYWWVLTRPTGRVIFTSSKALQVKEIVWREFRRLFRAAKYTPGPPPSLDPSSGWNLPDGRQAIGFTTREPDRAGGFSGAEQLFLADEASGVPDPIFEAFEGNLAGGGKLVLFGNPLRPLGQFYRAFTTERHSWHCIHISSEEAARYQEEVRQVPGLATQSWIDRRRRAWMGPGNPVYDSRVAGNFPTQASNAVIGLGAVEAAVERWTGTEDTPPAQPDLEEPLALGVDPARFGDDKTAICARRGFYSYPQAIHAKLDGFQVADEVLKMVRKLRRDQLEIPRVKIDVIGVGASAFDVLVRSSEVQAIPVNVAEAPTATDGEAGYHQLRDQIWFATRDWLEEGGAMAPDPDEEAELVAVTYEITEKGNYKVISKKRMKEELGRSPDRADARGLAIYEPPPVWIYQTDESGMDR